MKKLILASLFSLALISQAFAEDLWDEYRGVLKSDRSNVHSYEFRNPWGAQSRLVWVSTELTLSGATTAATSLIPAKSTYYNCVVRVLQTITGATTWDLGDGSDADRWGDNEALTAGTVTSETDGTAVPYGWSATAISPTFTANGSNFTGGKVRISCLTQTFDGAAK